MLYYTIKSRVSLETFNWTKDKPITFAIVYVKQHDDSFTIRGKIKNGPKLSQLGDWTVIFGSFSHRMKEQVAPFVREASPGAAVWRLSQARVCFLRKIEGSAVSTQSHRCYIIEEQAS